MTEIGRPVAPDVSGAISQCVIGRFSRQVDVSNVTFENR